MLQLLPFLAWLAALISAGLLAALRFCDELRGAAFAVLGTWFLAAAYCQFFSASALVAALGVAAQTLLAVSLIVRWKLASLKR